MLPKMVQKELQLPVQRQLKYLLSEVVVVGMKGEELKLKALSKKFWIQETNLMIDLLPVLYSVQQAVGLGFGAVSAVYDMIQQPGHEYQTSSQRSKYTD